MRCIRFFLLLFLLPTFLLALHEKESKNIRNQAFDEWKRSNELTQQLNKLGSNQTETFIHLLREAIACCQRAIAHYDKILNDISHKSKRAQGEQWRVDMKRRGKEDKKTYSAHLNQLQNVLQDTLSFERAKVLYGESGKKVESARDRALSCPRLLHNVDAVVAALNEAVKLCEEAASAVQEGFDLISSSSREADKTLLKQTADVYRKIANQYKQEAAEWPAAVLSQKSILKDRVALHKENSRLLEEKGLKRSSFEEQQQMVPILEQLIESGEKEAIEELAELKKFIALFEAEADAARLTENTPLLAPEKFTAREKQRGELFFKSDFLLRPSNIDPLTIVESRELSHDPNTDFSSYWDIFLRNILQNKSRPFAIPLDGQTSMGRKDFTLYTEQFYRFLVQSDTPASHLLVKVYENGEVVHEEKVSLPLKNTLSWERYLLADGMLFIPETTLKSRFGLDLRLQLVHDPGCHFSLIIAQKSTYSGYQFSVSLNDSTSLYACSFSEPPPWQLGVLRKPALPAVDRPIGKQLFPKLTLDLQEEEGPLYLQESVQFPLLDQLVEELKGDPLALAGYVQNEITFTDPFLLQKEGVFQAPGIHRNACMTFLEKRGSPWEQCQLLVYLLRKAGYQTAYAMGSLCSLPKAFAEKMLFTQLPEEQKEAQLHYPWVIFFNGEEWIALFPWMKEMQIHEGYDLYNFMPEEYASADRWILQYLKSDEKILKHIGPDGNDTAGVLFVRFVEEELRKQGLSLTDVGVHRTQHKKQFTSWEDFPRPSAQGRVRILPFLDEKIDPIFAFATVEIFSRENPEKKLKHIFPLASFTCSAIPLYFSPNGESNHHLHVALADQEELLLDLDSTDRTIAVKVIHEVPVGSAVFHTSNTLSMAKGTSAALCFHFGGASPEITSQFYEQFSREKEEKKRPQALLPFVGATYFEKCGRAEQILAALHKVNPQTIFAFGLAKLSPDSTGSLEADVKLPQVDMVWFHSPQASTSLPAIWHQEIYSATRQLKALVMLDFSSNEHQILREIFNDSYAISTVKLLQLAHLEQQKKGGEGTGFLAFAPSIFVAAEKTPQAAQSLYFPHLKDLDLRDVRAASPGQWGITKSLLGPESDLSDWSIAYMTPGSILSQNGTYKEMGTLLLCPHIQYALISSNNLLFHGGLGSPYSFFSTPEGEKWQPLIAPHEAGYLRENPFIAPLWHPDVRPDHKSLFNAVNDPVDIVTGAFYVDELDLVLPGPFPLQIRRNYNSQNPLPGGLGCGWKLSLNPFLIEQEGKLYAAEEDGTVIAYRFRPETSRWEVFPEDNPDLGNFTQKGIGSTANPFHAYIENNVLYGTDGSKRIFEEGLLKKWIDAKGNTLTFSYSKDRLSQIESSNGDFCGLHYNHQGKISEIYAKDGRRITYTYDSREDLVKVVLPNTAVISYEYDRFHRIFRETKPDGRVLENIYNEEGKVIKQRSPTGPQQEMTISATFTYQDGLTTVKDALSGCTIYKIFQKQIYKIIDPEGHQILQSWFIDEHTWFDPQTESVAEWNQKGGWPRSLKASTDKRGLTTYYLYDSSGNPEEIGLQGDDLTGGGETRIAEKRTYNALNLCIKEETISYKTITSYDSTFPYLPKKVEKYHENTLLSYVDLEYNALGQVQREEHSGAVTLWKYNARGFPQQKIQITGTSDPDVVTEYAYNNQGQCIQITTADSILKNDYDIMGNAIQSQVFSPSGTLLSALYTGYSLNNEPVWKQTANSQNTLCLDYHASGQLKASRQTLSPTNNIAYIFYEYNSRGDLIEEVDPLGYRTYRDYDLLARVKRETKEGLSTLFSYEPGGFIETITTPSGAQTTRLYTTNGLLKEEIYPDGTKSSVTYDFFGRPIRETKNDITWQIRYDDPNHRVIRTHLETKSTEIREFDARGNLIRLIDAAGYAVEKTYDGLGRLKTETAPGGEQLTWNYQGDTVICLLPSGEKTINRYEGGRVTESGVFDAAKNLIAYSSCHYNPELDKQETVQGEEITTTWMNALGLPIKVQKGDIAITYEYNARGDRIASTDGEGRTTLQTFDPLGRVSKKELPDGSTLKYDYDLDSNLTECLLPNNVSWKAAYDCMRRKCSEELHAAGDSSQRWEYIYTNGYLKEVKDPMQRIHAYLFDSQGRISQENVDEWQRTFTYDPRGLLSSAEQIGNAGHEHSLIERSYDSNRRLLLESIFLNSHLLQQTHQTWSPSSRSLQIDEHQRDFIYQNNQLVQVSTQGINLSYAYDLSGSLKSKTTPFSTRTLHYNSSGLPENIHTSLLDGSYPESLAWDRSGKLLAYSAPAQQKHVTYTPRGHLQSAGEENYEFDFGAVGNGIRTAGPDWYVSQDGLDPFGKIIAEMGAQGSLVTAYNPMGQVISQNQRQFAWDPWGRLLQVTDETFAWEASYDALGRRLQTRYTPHGGLTLITTSLYDPEEEFQEIGSKYGDKTFWKIYGPSSCDALTDETDTVFPMHDALGHLTGVVSQQGTLYSERSPSFYGHQATTPIPSNLLELAQSLTWHSKSRDPTGLVWMGARYYDPVGGRFLSPDPVGYPICLDLYAYANGDPINYIDPDGRFSSHVYESTGSSLINFLLQSPIITMFNAISSMWANSGFTSSDSYQVGSLDFLNAQINIINGINNTRKVAEGHALRLSQYAQGGKIHGLYNATHNATIDVVECLGGHHGFQMPPVQLLKKQWKDFIDTHEPGAKLLQFCHSGGAIHVYNALNSSPKHVRDSIIVVSISPAKIIPKELCFEAYNYASKRDFVHTFDTHGHIRHRNQLTILEPHEKAPFFDHDFDSPTFQKHIKKHIKKYLKEYEGKK